ncbi:hypothetical protein ACA910_018813 [Epithemia clementina (nom. ined.)]
MSAALLSTWMPFLVNGFNVAPLMVQNQQYYGPIGQGCRHNCHSAMELSAKARGRLKKNAGFDDDDVVSSGDSASSSSLRTDINWCPMPPNQKLPDEPDKVGLLDTELPTLKDKTINPTGAVAVVKASFNGQTYCFASSCPSCKIPLTKAKIMAPPAVPPVPGEDVTAPRLVCDFCKATYSLKQGQKVQSMESGGLLGGFVKSIFSAKDAGPLPMYKLGERKGKLVIAVD